MATVGIGPAVGHPPLPITLSLRLPPPLLLCQALAVPGQPVPGAGTAALYVPTPANKPARLPLGLCGWF